MRTFEPDQVDDIVQYVVGKDKVIKEDNTGRELYVDARMPKDLVSMCVAGFCAASTTGLTVASPVPLLSRL